VKRVDGFTRLDALFDEVLELDAGDRREFLSGLREKDSELAVRLERLIDHLDAVDGFLEQSASAARDRLLSSALAAGGIPAGALSRAAGDRVGAYRIEREIARGQRAVVYLARRDDREWNQRVAIKVLTHGIDSDDAQRRFRAERQILTVLRHPNISTLLDGGVAADGAPYIVMEYIEGLTVTEFCRVNALSLPARVRLCREICSGVASAHRQMIVHRDLKPSNIMVDRNGRVKLLDFGIAKLLASRAEGGIDPADSARTVDFGSPMTPRYASPEQLRQQTVTAASDIYQLGLVFAEILTGVPDARKALGIDLVSGPKHWPSRMRCAEGEGMPFRCRDLRGDLDGILLRALEARPEDRYVSVEALDSDLGNYLANRPVTARQATLRYRLGKFLRRRPVLATTVGILLVGSVAFVTTLYQFNRQLAAERAAAVIAAERAREVKSLLVDFIRSPDPWSGRGADTTVREVLRSSQDQVEQQLAGRPELQVELWGALADVYQGLAMHEQALAMRDRELALREQASDHNAHEWWQARRKQAQSLMARGDTRKAVSLLRELRSALAGQAPERWRERAIIEMELGQYHVTYGRTDDAIPLLRAAVNMASKVDDEGLAAQAHLALAVGLDYLGEYQEAHDLLVNGHERLLAQQGPSSVQQLLMRARIAANLSNQTRYDESIDIYQEVLPPMERRLGRLHHDVLATLNNLGFSHEMAGHLEQAASIHLDVLDRRRQASGDRHRSVADSLQNLGSVLKRLGRQSEAIPALEEAAAIYREVNTPGHPRTAYPHVSLAIIYADVGAVEGQETHARRAIELLGGDIAETHPALLRSQCLLGDALIQKGQRQEGLPLLRTGVAGLERQSDLYATHLAACREALARAELGDV
jgi:serine/threonine-protein kinase